MIRAVNNAKGIEIIRVADDIYFVGYFGGRGDRSLVKCSAIDLQKVLKDLKEDVKMIRYGKIYINIFFPEVRFYFPQSPKGCDLITVSYCGFMRVLSRMLPPKRATKKIKEEEFA